MERDGLQQQQQQQHQRCYGDAACSERSYAFRTRTSNDEQITTNTRSNTARNKLVELKCENTRPVISLTAVTAIYFRGVFRGGGSKARRAEELLPAGVIEAFSPPAMGLEERCKS